MYGQMHTPFNFQAVCMRRLPSAEKSAKDRFKTALCAALRQSFLSAPGCKHPNQKQQDDEYDHSSRHICEDQVWPAVREGHADEWSGKNRQDEQETATSSQPGPWSPGPQQRITALPAGSRASRKTSEERIILRLRWCLRIGRRIAWLCSSRKLSWNAGSLASEAGYHKYVPLYSCGGRDVS